MQRIRTEAGQQELPILVNSRAAKQRVWTRIQEAELVMQPYLTKNKKTDESEIMFGMEWVGGREAEIL